MCSGKTAHTDVNIHTHERDFNCERYGFFSETKLVERAGRKFWEHTMEMPMSEDGVVAWPELEPEGVRRDAWVRGCARRIWDRGGKVTWDELTKEILTDIVKILGADRSAPQCGNQGRRGRPQSLRSRRRYRSTRN